MIDYDTSFSGLVGFGVDAAGATITEVGRVEHPAQPADPDVGVGITPRCRRAPSPTVG